PGPLLVTGVQAALFVEDDAAAIVDRLDDQEVVGVLAWVERGDENFLAIIHLAVAVRIDEAGELAGAEARQENFVTARRQLDTVRVQRVDHAGPTRAAVLADEHNGAEAICADIVGDVQIAADLGADRIQQRLRLWTEIDGRIVIDGDRK